MAPRNALAWSATLPGFAIDWGRPVPPVAWPTWSRRWSDEAGRSPAGATQGAPPITRRGRKHVRRMDHPVARDDVAHAPRQRRVIRRAASAQGAVHRRVLAWRDPAGDLGAPGPGLRGAHQ